MMIQSTNVVGPFPESFWGESRIRNGSIDRQTDILYYLLNHEAIEDRRIGSGISVVE